jgi:hypothetical protein
MRDDALRVEELHRAKTVAARARAGRVVEREQARLELGQRVVAGRARISRGKEMFLVGIDFERDRLTSAIRRVSLLSNERSRAVRFLISSGKVEVTSQSPDLGDAKEELLVTYDGPDVQICFNAQYVTDFLSAVETDQVSLSFRDEMSQAVMKPVGADGYDYTYVIMPMRP